MHPYTGSLSRSSASNTKESTASCLCDFGTSFRILVTLLAPKTLWTLANLLGSSA
ncbi:hypothetical protein HanRHA438_Chr05g0221381 [Helianthus annuus]|nr:hypothetical protein HanRHA438_Chr05g0221381 [Helianthus annuus]